MKCLLRRMLDETEFLSDYGVLAISKIREAHPYTFRCYGNEVYVKYEPAESSPGGFWRKFKLARTDLDAVNYLIIESLQNFTNTMAAISKWSARQGLEGS